MSDGEAPKPEAPFFTDRAPSGRAACKKCKQKIDKGMLRIAKLASNPFGDGMMKMWHHVNCLFEVFKKQRATTARISGPDDVGGWDDLLDEDKEEILKQLPDDVASQARARVPKPRPKNEEKTKPSGSSKDKVKKANSSKESEKIEDNEETFNEHKDNSFREFRRLCADLSNESSYTGKTALVKALFDKGSDGTGFKGDVKLWCRLLLPGAVKRVYNVQSRQLAKLLARVLGADASAMLVDLEQGDVAETVRVFFERSQFCPPCKKSRLTLQEVDDFLEQLAALTKEDEQAQHFQEVAARCTSNDLKMIVRLVKRDLRINAGPKHVLTAVHPDAYPAFQASRDLDAVLSRCLAPLPTGVKAALRLMTPVQPMLAAPCRATRDALDKCPRGLLAEVKYDGERVQVHKRGDEFRYYSRSLKPVLAHKVAHFSNWLPQAFPRAGELVLDAEVLLVDTRTGLPLPFGTLGVHKKAAFQDASVCLFVFDCLLINGDSLLGRPLSERRLLLAENLTEVRHRVVLSELHEISSVPQLDTLVTRVLRQGLEGLVLKDPEGSYEPGARRWLKVKRDYLMGGAMADSVDLLVLGAWFGTGAKGGMMSSFLMGVRDGDKWRTVTKVHGGFDDAALAALQTSLPMTRIGRDPTRCPSWLLASRSMVPDLVADDLHAMPVWEVTGAEFTQNQVHSADGVSIRFPRVTRVRDDKDWRSATSLDELRAIFAASRQASTFSLGAAGDDEDEEGPSGVVFTELTDEEVTPKKKVKEELTPKKKVKQEVTPKKKVKEELTPKKKIKEEITPKKKNIEELTPKKKVKEEITPKKKNLEELTPKKKVKEEITPKKEAMSKRTSDSAVASTHALKRAKPDAVEPTSSTRREPRAWAPSLRKPLPDCLLGVAVVLPPATSRLLRHLVAFGGTALASCEAERSSHVLHAPGSGAERLDWPRIARHVQLAWLEDSIKLRARQSEALYAVFLKDT